MSKTKNHPKSPQDGLLRGFTAVAVAAAALASALFLLIPSAHAPTHSLPEQTTAPTQAETILTQSPIPANPYGPEDFDYEGGYLACMTGSASLGVDVSAHQGTIDWQQVRSAGMEFAMIRIGYRGYTSGGIYADEYAQANLEGAREAGLKTGIYFYSQAVNPTEAALEAAYCISFLENHQIDMPVVFDWEYVSNDARTGNMDSRTLMECIRTFCDAVADAGYEPMVYFNPTLADSLLELEELVEYPWWLAMYSSQMTWPYAVEMWQYTANGNVPGITGDADINLWFNG